MLLALLLTAAQCGGGGAFDSRPVANAGADQTVNVGEAVSVDGSASSDLDGDALTFAWSLESIPGESAASLASISTPATGFTPDVVGEYVVSLTVSDGVHEASDSMSVFASGEIAVFTELLKLTANDAAPGDNFGLSVAIDGDHAIVGAPFDDDDAADSGSAYVFRRSGDSWVQSMKLPPAPLVVAPTTAALSAGDRFGISVAISGNYAIVGAYRDDDGGTDSGAAYVYERCDSSFSFCEQPWIELGKLTADDAFTGDNFGYSVAIDGDWAIVGAFSESDPSKLALGIDQGAAYTFKRSGDVWTQVEKLVAGDASADALFGWSVAMSGDTAIIGAFGDSSLGTEKGSAYVFQRAGDAWMEIDKLTSDDAASGDLFGSSVAISGDTAVVGAFRDDDVAGIEQGSAYVFERNGDAWTQSDKLTADDASGSDFFGFSVAIAGDHAIIGTLAGDGAAGSDQGAAYVFARNGDAWTQIQKLTAEDAAPGDFFGYAVAIAGVHAMIGAAHNDDGGDASGSAYVFTK